MRKRLKMKLLKKQNVKCTYCDGLGQYENSYDDMYGGNHSLGWWHCEMCDGIGEVNKLDEFKAEIKSKKLIKKLF